MTLKAQIASDIDAVFLNTDEFAIDAVYNSKDGTIVDKDIKVIREQLVNLQQTDYGAAGMESFLIAESDIPDPVIYDTITVGTDVYTVRNRVNGSDGTWSVMCHVDQRQSPGA